MHCSIAQSFKFIFPGISLFFLILASSCNSNANDKLVENNPKEEKSSEEFTLPPGFKLEVYAENVENARGMELSESGVLYVGTRGEGKVYAVIDKDNDYKADEVKVIAENLKMPVGLDLHQGDLYVSSTGRIVKLPNIENQLDNPPKPVLVNDELPNDRHHGWKFIKFGPDGKLYVPVGAPCNICEEENEMYASIMRMNPDGSELEVFAHGVRNSVGFDWHPTTNELWFSDNGRDWLGDDMPPCELNHAPSKGLHFGYPYCHGDDISDPDFGETRPCSEFKKPVQNLGPHVAPLGIEFYTGTMFPPEYRNQVFIAEHGSWNRSTKIGYRIMLVTLDGNRSTGYKPFAEGWLKKGKVSGRPVDIEAMPDGSILVSDDHADKIYRISYTGQ